MREPFGEFVQRARVIEVVVRGERERGLLEQVARRFVQARDAEPGVDEQRAIAPRHEPDIAARERIGERLPEPPDHVADPFAREPIPDCDLQHGFAIGSPSFGKLIRPDSFDRIHSRRRLSM